MVEARRGAPPLSGGDLLHLVAMKYGARNQIEAKVTRLKKGDVMSQVSLSLEGPAALSSVLTTESLEELGLQVGDRVKVVVKAIHVLLIKE